MTIKNFEDIHPDHFTYELPEEYIAKEPLEDRSKSRLLHYRKGKITHQQFGDITRLIPSDSLIIFNDTRVIPARLIAYKPTGARIEVFLLEPISPSAVMEEAMHARQSSIWECLIGNAKKWKIDSEIQLSLEKNVILTLKRIAESQVSFTWNSEATFSEVIDQAGKVPLPPYIDREPTEIDIPRYQTVYSKVEGAVAAPTAGLHFTDDIMSHLAQSNKIDYVTLHVSAGTFQPIKTHAGDHPMHREEIIITDETISNLLSEKPVIAIGTTSMRTLESLYWYGVRILSGSYDFEIHKLDPYQLPQDATVKQSLIAIRDYMTNQGLRQLRGYTEIFLFPGYDFRICQGLVTNFHLPGTTLMMLIAAFIGDDWKEVYQQALGERYRFLSYGDSSLLIPKSSKLAI